MRITAQNLIDIKPQLADFLSNLEVGDAVRGKIIEVLGESISLKTASGQIFTAALMTDAELMPGQTVEFLINSITEEGVFAELKADTKKQGKVTEDVKLQQTLKQMDMKPDKANIDAAKLLLKYNMPITKENVLRLTNTQKSIETMAKPDIVKAFSLMQSEQNIQNTEFVKLAKQATVLEQQGKTALEVLKQDIPDMPEVQNREVESPKAAASNAVVNKEEIKEENIEQPKKIMLQAEAGINQIDKQQTAEKKPEQELKQLVKLLNTEEMQKSVPKVERLIDTLLKVFETASKAQPEHSAYLISKDLEVTPAAVKALTDNIAGQGKLGMQVKELEKLVEVLDQKLEQSSTDVKELKQTVKGLFLKPEELRDKEQVQEVLKEIIKTAHKAETILKANGLEDKVDRTVLADIKGNFDFQQNISNNVNYIQIPLLINDNKTTAELYVFNNRKKGKHVNPENASILIALDLVNLGHIESLISVSKKTVSVNFKVERDELKKFISGNAEILKQALEARGYSLSTIQFIDMAERFSLLELEEGFSRKPDKMHLDIKV